jgi:NADH:ubiquinone oxidoreductase subunit 3 (subunit A)
VKKRPSRLWLLFYGRQRSGVPYILIAMLLAIFTAALIFALPGGPDYSRAVIGFFLFLLVVAIVAALVVALVFPRRRR